MSAMKQDSAEESPPLPVTDRRRSKIPKGVVITALLIFSWLLVWTLYNAISPLLNH